MIKATPSLDVEILSRVIQPERASLSPELARVILEMSFSTRDLQEMERLSDKARRGSLTESEQAELDSFERVGNFLSIIKSKARQSLVGAGK